MVRSLCNDVVSNVEIILCRMKLKII